MKSLKLIAAMAICSLFIIGVQKSDAIKITEFPSDTEDYSYGGYTYHMADVRTDKPIYYVFWNINGGNGYSETLGGTTNYASYFPCYDPTPSSRIPGSIKGINYRISVEVWEWDVDAEVFRSATASYKVRMFESVSISDTKYPRGIHNEDKLGDGIYGSVTLSRHYHDGQSIVVDGSVYARNRTNMTLDASVFYRHTRFGEDGRTIWKVEDPPLDQPNPYADDLEPGETYNHSGSSAISFSVPTDNGDIGKTDRFIMNAHIHMEVGGQVWHDEGGAWTHTFTDEDNESYEGD